MLKNIGQDYIDLFRKPAQTLINFLFDMPATSTEIKAKLRRLALSWTFFSSLDLDTFLNRTVEYASKANETSNIHTSRATNNNQTRPKINRKTHSKKIKLTQAHDSILSPPLDPRLFVSHQESTSPHELNLSRTKEHHQNDWQVPSAQKSNDYCRPTLNPQPHKHWNTQAQTPQSRSQWGHSKEYNLTRHGVANNWRAGNLKQPNWQRNQHFHNKRSDFKDGSKIGQNHKQGKYVKRKPVLPDFSTEFLQTRHETVIQTLYEQFDFRCSLCGLRTFKADVQEHLDGHFKQNTAKPKKESRSWFASNLHWVSSPPKAIVKNIPTMRALMQQEEELPKVRVLTVPAEEDFACCPQCGESFEELWDHEQEKWMFQNALKVPATNDEQRKNTNPNKDHATWETEEKEREQRKHKADKTFRGHILHQQCYNLLFEIVSQ